MACQQNRPKILGLRLG